MIKKKNLIEAEQGVFATKQDFEELRKYFSRLLQIITEKVGVRLEHF